MRGVKSEARWISIGLLVSVISLVLITLLSPMERTLGDRARLVYFHGAWVWAGKIAFAVSAATALIGLLRGSTAWQRYSLALGRVGMVFWLTYLPLSLYVQEVNWGGIFWDEPRWRIPLIFGIVGLLLQIGLALVDDLRVASAANLVFGVALWWMLGTITNVLHPDSPIAQSGSLRIQVFFGLLLAFSVAFGALLARQFYILSLPRRGEKA